MNRKILCGLDIGSSKLTAVLAKIEKNNIRILANDTISVSGIAKGVVEDLGSLTDCIRQILDKVSTKSGIKIKKILVSINGNHINARKSFATLALSERDNRHISTSDIAYLRRQTRLLGLSIDEVLLHEFPQGYILDDSHSTFNPLGLLARKVQLNSYLLSGSYALLGNIITAIHQAGYEVLDTLFSAVASSFSIASEEERKKGIILIDLGACFTSILFFKDDALRDLKIISFGGKDITDDISKGLGLPWELAEEIKKSSLVLSTTDSRNSDRVVIRRGGSYKTLERRAIYESTNTRLEEFLNQIKHSINASVWKDKMECGIVGVGGSAHLEGILERIELSSGMPTRLGYIKNNSSLDANLVPEYAASVGLIYYGYNLKDSVNLKSLFSGKTFFERIVNFLFNLYRDYF